MAYEIYRVNPDSVVTFAAQELKKYLRMMMPEAGEVYVSLDPAATDGFRLGLLEDFGLPSEAEDPVLDDVIHVDTDTQGGILAGSNSRSVLFSVYRFFRENGLECGIWIRSLGFGAGMGLPNMKKYADTFEISSVVGEGTDIVMTVLI